MILEFKLLSKGVQILDFLPDVGRGAKDFSSEIKKLIYNSNAIKFTPSKCKGDGFQYGHRVLQLS
jgi:hypothetical protein